MDTDAPDAARLAELRDGLIAELQEVGALRSASVERAVRAVPRHLFVPEEPAERAYEAERALVTKRDERGVSLSSVSAARIQAFMAEQAGIEPGMRVLEIGSGGYNAALLAELVGVEGQVTSIDIDPDVTGRARRLLDATGYGRVRVLVADGHHGEPGGAPYDRIVVTVESADVPAAWIGQLTGRGRIVVPLRMRGLTRSVAFDLDTADGTGNGEGVDFGGLIGRDYDVCGFVPMRGTGASDETLIVLHEDTGSGDQVGLRLDTDPPGTQLGDVGEAGPVGAGPDRLRAAFGMPRHEAWAGVTMGVGESYDDLDLWLATVVDGYALLAATRAARDHGLVAAASPLGISAVVEDDGSFAYLTLRPTSPQRALFEFGAVAHGPGAQRVADRLAELVGRWGRDHRGARATFTAVPAGAAVLASGDVPVAGRVIHRRESTITISWPSGR